MSEFMNAEGNRREHFTFAQGETCSHISLEIYNSRACK